MPHKQLGILLEAMNKWGVQQEGSYDYLQTIKQPTEAEKLSEQAGTSLVTSPIQASVNVYVILIGSKTILVDAGSRCSRPFNAELLHE